MRRLSVVVAALFLAQVLAGAATVLLKFPAELRSLHLALATPVWGSMVALGAMSFSLPDPAHREAVYA